MSETFILEYKEFQYVCENQDIYVNDYQNIIKRLNFQDSAIVAI